MTCADSVVTISDGVDLVEAAVDIEVSLVIDVNDSAIVEVDMDDSVVIAVVVVVVEESISKKKGCIDIRILRQLSEDFDTLNYHYTGFRMIVSYPSGTPIYERKPDLYSMKRWW